MIGGKEQGVFFTSGGSESNYLAIQSLLNARTKKHIITTPMEHASIRSYFQSLKSKGYTITEIPVDKSGLLCLVDLEATITEDTVLASIQHGNSEIGTVQNITEIGALLKKYNVLFHTDCVQTFGKLPIHVLRWALIVFLFQHIKYTDQRCRRLLHKSAISLGASISGNFSRKGFRPGTVNVPGIASFNSR